VTILIKLRKLRQWEIGFMPSASPYQKKLPFVWRCSQFDRLSFW